VLRNGCIFQSDFHNGRMHGPGEIYWPDGQSYVGQFSHNQMGGEGLFTYPNGSTYEGAVHQGGHPECPYTVIITINLDSSPFTGAVQKGLRHGQGKFTDTSGANYVGAWEHGVRNGSGCQLYNFDSGATYSGAWKADERQGHGEMLYPSGNRYVGEWKKGIRHGEGEMHWEGRKERYIGQWCDGLANGHGEHTWLSPNTPMPPMGATQEFGLNLKQTSLGARDGMVDNRYAGQWSAGKRHGEGIFHYMDGTVYEGQWEKNMKHGAGIFRLVDGKFFASTWVHDRMRDPEDQAKVLPNKAMLYTKREEEEAAEASMEGLDEAALLARTKASSGLDLEFVLKEVKGAHQRSRDLEVKEEVKNLKKVKDLMFRSRSELADVFRYYASLGVSRPEECNAMSNHQFCQLCKDCKLPTQSFGLPVIDQIYKEGVETAGTAHLSLQMFMTVLLKVAHLRFQVGTTLCSPLVSSCWEEADDESVCVCICTLE